MLPNDLRDLIWTRGLGQRLPELVARGDVELRKHLAQVEGDRVLADKQPLADLGVRQSATGEARDLSFLSRQLEPALAAAPPYVLVRGPQLALGPAGKSIDPRGIEHLVRGAQLLAGVRAAALTPQPFDVEKVCAGEMHATPGMILKREVSVSEAVEGGVSARW